MKFLCVSDGIDPYVFSSRIAERFPGVDAVLCAGGAPPEYIDFLASALGVPVFFVSGARRFSGARPRNALALGADFACRRAAAGGRALLTAGAPDARGEDGAYLSEGEMAARLWALTPALLWNRLRYGRFLDVFLTHAPPSDSPEAGERCYECFRSFRERFSPACHVHGGFRIFDPDAPRVIPRGASRDVNASGFCTLEL